jgi:hypothetical protein
MSHSFHSADRATYHRVIGAALAAIIAVCLTGISFFAKSDHRAASASTLRADTPVTTTDSSFAVIQ